MDNQIRKAVNVKTRVNAGALNANQSQAVKLKTRIAAGGLTPNHNQAGPLKS